MEGQGAGPGQGQNPQRGRVPSPPTSPEEDTSESEAPTSFNTQLKTLLNSVAEGEVLPENPRFNYPPLTLTEGEQVPPLLQGVIERQEFMFEALFSIVGAFQRGITSREQAERVGASVEALSLQGGTPGGGASQGTQRGVPGGLQGGEAQVQGGNPNPPRVVENPNSQGENSQTQGVRPQGGSAPRVELQGGQAQGIAPMEGMELQGAMPQENPDEGVVPQGGAPQGNVPQEGGPPGGTQPHLGGLDWGQVQVPRRPPPEGGMAQVLGDFPARDRSSLRAGVRPGPLEVPAVRADLFAANRAHAPREPSQAKPGAPPMFDPKSIRIRDWLFQLDMYFELTHAKAEQWSSL